MAPDMMDAFSPTIAAARWLGAVVCAVSALYVAAPAAAAGKEERAQKAQTGLASFYGRAFDGKTTASGETFDSDELTAAHPSYPLGTRVRVTNLEKGRSVVVRVTDRGPTKPNRREGVIIDLSRAAATKLEMRKDGRVRVRVEVLEWGDEKATKAAAAQGG